jgi:hypothetical protein
LQYQDKVQYWVNVQLRGLQRQVYTRLICHRMAQRCTGMLHRQMMQCCQKMQCCQAVQGGQTMQRCWSM